jgi:uncharacterized membrane protein
MVNVPLNNRLDRGGDGRPDRQWHSFQQSWTPANHIRAALSVAGAVGMLIPIHNH